MPKFEFDWYAQVQGTVVIEAEDGDAADEIFSEYALEERMRLFDYDILDIDLMHVREL
jgi:hypothetical protein